MRQAAWIRGLVAAAVASPLLFSACARTPEASTDATAAADSAAQANIAAVQNAMEEMWNKQNFAVAPQLYAPGAVNYTNGVRDTLSAEAFIRQTYAQWKDVKVSFDDSFAAGDRVAMRWTFAGTNLATGKSVSVPGTSIMRLEDGKIAESYDSYDVMPFMVASGATVTPPPAAPPAGQ